MPSSNAARVLGVAGRWSLVLAPLGLVIGWALNYDSVSAFLAFDLSAPYVESGRSSSAEQFIATITGPDGGFRQLLLPHYFVYAAMPLFIAAGLFLASRLFRAAPWWAAVGAALTTVGAVCFVGVLGAWLAFPAIGKAPGSDATSLRPVVEALTTVKGVLLVSTALSVLVFVGLIVFGAALYRGGLVPRWSAVLLIAGNVMILAFAGTENWMALGAACVLVGLFPLVLTDVAAKPSESDREAASGNPRN